MARLLKLDRVVAGSARTSRLAFLESLDGRDGVTEIGDLGGDDEMLVSGLGWRRDSGRTDGVGDELAGEVEGCAAAREAFGPSGAAGTGGVVSGREEDGVNDAVGGAGAVVECALRGELDADAGRGDELAIGDEDVDLGAGLRVVEAVEQGEPVHVLDLLEGVGDEFGADSAEAQVDAVAEPATDLKLDGRIAAGDDGEESKRKRAEARRRQAEPE